MEKENTQLQKNEHGGFVSKMINNIESFEKATEFGLFIIKSGYAPKHFDGKPEAIILAIDAGAKLGFDWFQSIQEGYVVNGIPGYKGKALKGLVLASGVCVKWETEFTGSLADGTRTCTITYQRKGGGVQTRSYGVENAKQAQLWGKKKRYNKDKRVYEEYDDSWTKHPEDMLEWKCVSRVLNDFADITKGFRPIEDLQDYKDDETTMTIRTEEGIVVTPYTELKTEESNGKVASSIEAKDVKVKKLAGKTEPKVQLQPEPKSEPKPETKVEPEIQEPEVIETTQANPPAAGLDLTRYEESLRAMSPQDLGKEFRAKNAKGILPFSVDQWIAGGGSKQPKDLIMVLVAAHKSGAELNTCLKNLGLDALINFKAPRGLDEQLEIMDAIEAAGADVEILAIELGFPSKEDMLLNGDKDLILSKVQ